jgi:uncharacterized repeat protein (TIGR03803 family)
VLIEGSDGYLYGTTAEYGAGNAGTIFAVAKVGTTFPDSTTFKVLHTLAAGTDGSSARAGLREGSDGRLYGTTWQGGTANVGVIFALAKDGSEFTVLHNFGDAQAGTWCASQLVEGSDGRLYGTTDIGGNINAGVIFAIDKGGDNSGSGYAVLRRSDGNGAVDGARSGSGLLKAADGKLYGVFSSGGTDPSSNRYFGYGTIYRIAENGSDFAVLRAMNHQSDGRNPVGKPLLASDGRLYGTAFDSANGGTGGTGFSHGTIYSMNRDGTLFTVLHEFPFLGTSQNAGTVPGALGLNPNGDLIEGSDGKLYGTTSAGGEVYGRGEVFRMNHDGTGFSILTTGFPGNTIGVPLGGVVEGSDGKLYGTHSTGGPGGSIGGGLYSLNKDGTSYTVLRQFSPTTDGGAPQAPLVGGIDGRLYGTNRAGGTTGAGTVFAFDEGGGGFVVLHHFNSSADGGTPYAGLTVGPGGTLYGTTSTGGSGGGGTVYSLNTDGAAYQVLHAFNTGGSNFRRPAGGVVFGGEGRLYGMVDQGGAKGSGALYSLKPDGSDFVIEHEIDPDLEGGNGGGVRSFDLTSDFDGTVYGLSRLHGAYSAGTAVAFGFPPVISSPLTASGTFGDPFSYSITATHAPTDFDAFPLPASLSVDYSTGVISGTPTQTGLFAVNIAASNVFGSNIASLNLTIDKAIATVALSNLAQVSDGSAKSAIAITTPAGMGLVFTYDGSASAPTKAGSYAVVATVDDVNYTGSTSGTLVIGQATAGISISGTSQTYDGTSKSVTVTTAPAGLSTHVTYEGSATAPTNTGSYAVVVTINDSN